MPTYDENGALLVRDLAGSTFIALTDTPAAYAGNANKVLFVNATPDAVEFASTMEWDDVNHQLQLETGGAAALENAQTLLNPDSTNGAAVGVLFGVNAGGQKKGLIAAVRTGSNGRVAMVFATDDTNDASDADLADERMRITQGGDVGINDPAPSRRLQVVDDSVSTNVIIPITRLESQVSGGAGAAGHGPGLEFTGETTTTENTAMGQVAARWSTATHASRRARLELYAAYIGTDVLVGVIEAPTNASADGNARGVGAVDLQGWRSAVAQVASGTFAVLIGGSGGIASGGYAVGLGGLSNVASGVGAVALGGRFCIADRYGQVASASNLNNVAGDAQGTIQMVAIRSQAAHVLNTWYSLFLDGAATSERMTIPADTAWTFRAMVVGLTANAAQQFSYEIVGLIERDNAGNTTMAASTTTTIFESDANYDCQAIADDANEALEIQVRRTGGVDYNIRWVATIRTAEASFA